MAAVLQRQTMDTRCARCWVDCALSNEALAIPAFAPPPSLSDSAGSRHAACKAGASPKAMPLKTVTAARNGRVGASACIRYRRSDRLNDADVQGLAVRLAQDLVERAVVGSVQRSRGAV